MTMAMPSFIPHTVRVALCSWCYPRRQVHRGLCGHLQAPSTNPFILDAGTRAGCMGRHHESAQDWPAFAFGPNHTSPTRRNTAHECECLNLLRRHAKGCARHVHVFHFGTLRLLRQQLWYASSHWKVPESYSMTPRYASHELCSHSQAFRMLGLEMTGTCLALCRCTFARPRSEASRLEGNLTSAHHPSRISKATPAAPISWVCLECLKKAPRLRPHLALAWSRGNGQSLVMQQGPHPVLVLQTSR